ncbi:YiiX/YebB-like N1pC/P60 family cysteine hydrolase [Acinetobacter sp. YH01020]|uniref:YiiX/YebB-like N1pC/P60 family cysteine hydrolase n=1 Tax=Acinetobacter sp. YH01020 TaxID=2601034 RepID=UPI00211E3F37|nr:YiiX/YebB-like N1pC/P60 family cysteine hydrolase [Acinetobacter sp. YH01020]
MEHSLKKVGLRQNRYGSPYDIYFEWDDRAIYCSEIVWKAYQHALGIELSPLQQLKQFDLKQNEVQRLMRQRYGQNILLNEQVIAPKAIYDSKLLKEIFRN